MGGDLSRFQRISRSGKVHPYSSGNPYLKGALGIAAMAAARSHDTYYSTKCRHLATLRGSIKAVVAIDHAIWNMLQACTTYSDPGGDFYVHRDPDKVKRRAIDQLRNLGYTVTLEPTAEVA